MHQAGSLRSASVAIVASAILALGAPAGAVPAAAAPAGEATWALHISLPPSWLDPAETPGIITPFVVIYALHDALLKPMPGDAMTPSLADSWSSSKDGLTYEFVLRKNARFHNGEVVTAEDVKFSFERYRGTNAKLLKDKVREIEVVDAQRVRFRLKEPFPDFMTFYATPATGAAWIVPKKYIERVGDEGFKKHPIGAGPYKFVSFRPGVELTLEAHEQYWRKTPNLKTIVFRVIPDESTRLAALKRGEVDVAYSITGALAEELRRTPVLKLQPTYFTFTWWLSFLDMWDAKSPWHDKRVRLAANHAIDRAGINQAAYLGLSKVSHSLIPQAMDFYWAPPPYTYDPAKAKRLLAEAGYPGGFEGGELSGDMIYGSAIGEPVANYLQAAGIRIKLRPLERAAFYNQLGEKKLRGVAGVGSGAPGNAAIRFETFVIGAARYAYGTIPEIDDLFQQQAKEMDRNRREAILHRMQQIIHDRVLVAPVLEPAFLNGSGPRLEDSGLGLIASHAYSAPYEDLRLKK